MSHYGASHAIRRAYAMGPCVHAAPRKENAGNGNGSMGAGLQQRSASTDDTDGAWAHSEGTYRLAGKVVKQ